MYLEIQTAGIIMHFHSATCVSLPRGWPLALHASSAVKRKVVGRLGFVHFPPPDLSLPPTLPCNPTAVRMWAALQVLSDKPPPGQGDASCAHLVRAGLDEGVDAKGKPLVERESAPRAPEKRRPKTLSSFEHES